MKKQSPRYEDMAKRICLYYDKLKGNRVNWDTHWNELSQYVMLNDRYLVYGQYIPGGGEKKTNLLLDATGVHSNELLASALHSMLTNPTSYWFGVETGVPEIDREEEAHRWFQELQMKMHNILNNSNFQTEIHEVYLALGGFGTACMRIEADKEKVVRFQARPIYETYIAENNKGIVDTVYRCYKWSLRQIAEEFGVVVLHDDLAKLILERDPKQEEEHEVIHAIYPRESWDNQLPKTYRYASVYMLKDKKWILSEGGFKTMPVVMPRWTKVSGEVYGRSPGMKALPDLKTLNKMMEVTIRSAQKTIDPPLQMPDDGFILPLNLKPGGINYYRPGTPDRIEPILTGSRIDFGFEMMNDMRQRIRSAFFIDQLQLQEGPQMTATEVLQRTEEKLRLMGPILGRQNHELLQPMMERVFDIMLDRGLVPAPPEILQGRSFQFSYTSQIVRAQRLSELGNINRAVQVAAPIIQADPTAMDNIDPDGTIRYVTRLLGLPNEMLRKEEEVEEIRNQRRAQQAQQMQMQQQMADAEEVAKVGGVMVKAQGKEQAL